ncbi:putative pentatricopeptide repeat-containing protein At5g08490 [Diospyros lotus]|uniref:putative pentatricopeptide repeat-containing protein At5g08490 n=1 Tax=Diospyros lotus TaxID=55363 RepID=UPI0022507DF2|nr:putative pentatricopeptide repeat-containing protein At5g08490 [Diospyros lotus]XP_052179379.1 putative pentatricopeptide repeat-containing protein At5g08490 [Diospyros lotus]XP_052179380.1 putative pentatricopeptide repeat-containing protein At5g08490 [Diospyros lotus]XP_052179381.1 putative pentatricopeptide repeat-containing protein At5g08490 [Diospyros lotus]
MHPFLLKIGYPLPFRPDYQAFAAIFKSCAAFADINLGKALHSHVVKLGHTSCQLVSKALLNMYAKCNAFGDCHKLFGLMGHRDTVMWNIVLSGFAGSRNHDTEVIRLFRAMHIGMDPNPSSVTVAIILPVCVRLGALDASKNVHSYVIKSGLISHTLVGNALVSVYAKSGDVHDDAYAMFEEIPEKDVVSWNAMIAGFAENNFMDDAFKLFSWMLRGATAPNCATIANILPICGKLKENATQRCGKEMHCYVLRRAELIADVSVENALVTFYARSGRMKEAEHVFWRIRMRDLVSWNTMISGYSLNSEWLRAVELFHEFFSVGKVGPDSVTLLSILPACAHICNLELGKQIHGYIIKHSQISNNAAVGNALISFYAKCGDIDDAFRTFLSIHMRDLISWNTMLDAFAESQLESEFVYLLHWMLDERIRPDSITLLAIIQFCATFSRIDKVREAHGFCLKSGLLLGDVAPTLANAIIDAYAKCGDMLYASKIFESLSGKRNVVTCNSILSGYVNCGSHDDAQEIFHSMSERDLTTWNLMIRVYAENDCSGQALSLFRELENHGMKPDSMTMMSLLPICAQIASVYLLRQCHGYVVRSCFQDIHLKAALIDTYSKCGSINCAYKLFQSTRQKDLVIFTAMIGGYAMHGMGVEALGVFSHMLELGVKPDHVTLTALLSACSHTGLVDEGVKIFDSIEKLHGTKPTVEQSACVVDLLARGGRINEAYSFVTKMSVQANASVLGALLSGCRTHHHVEMGRAVADQLLKVESSDIGNYVVLSNLYAAEDRWDGVLEIRKLMRTRDLKKPAGCSWIEVEKRKNVFMAGDCSHPQRSIIYNTLTVLDQQIKEPFQLGSG